MTASGAHSALVSGGIDADVHASTQSGWSDLEPYVDANWGRRLSSYRNILARPRGPAVQVAAAATSQKGDTAARPGSDPAIAREDLFDRLGLDYAILVPLESLYLAELLMVHDTLTLAGAYNDYFAETWLSADPRFALAIMVSPHHPRASVAEIERWADHPGVVAIVMPLIDMLMGKRHYRPIYQAADATGMPIITHSGHTPFEGTPPYAGGAPSDYIQRHCLVAGLAMSNIVSLVFEGTFDLYPRLKCVFSGCGFSWLMHLMWRMDQTWDSLPVTSRIVQERPSEIVRRHVRLTTGAEEEPAEPEGLARTWPLWHGEDTILYGSNYPFSLDGALSASLEKLPAVQRGALVRDRACETFPRLAPGRGPTGRTETRPSRSD
jgi:predicted TIM-barrel fold metal-dependent hydrolase